MFGIQPAGGSESKSAGSFQDQLGGQLKQQLRERAASLFDEILQEADDLLEHIDLSRFERYRHSIRSLLDDVLRHAYTLQTEHVTDSQGRQRLYSTVGVIDGKLEDLAKRLLEQNTDKLRYLARIDEIRGLVMDLLL